MSDWPGWDTQLLEAIGAPLTKENYAVVDAEQQVEGAGGQDNPYNIGYYGSNPQYGPGTTYGAYTPYGYGQTSAYPPTQDFPNTSAGIWATTKWYESNAPSLLQALRAGDPLNPNVNWEIHMGAATPDPQYTAKVRGIASQDYGSGSSGAANSPCMVNCMHACSGGNQSQNDCQACLHNCDPSVFPSPGGPGGIGGGGTSPGGASGGAGTIAGVGGDIGSALSALEGGDITGVITETILRLVEFVAGAALVYLGLRGLVGA